MKYIPFILDDIGCLETALSQEFKTLSLALRDGRWAPSVTLWSKGLGVKIQSQVYDVSDRLEVGVLKFSRVKHPQLEEKKYSLQNLFAKGSKIQKLIIHESGCTLESGLMIEASNGDNIVIVPNAMPFSVAISSSIVKFDYFEPEYPLKDYRLQVLKKSV